MQLERTVAKLREAARHVQLDAGHAATAPDWSAWWVRRAHDRSPAVARARAREEWRVAEAGRLAHLIELGRPLCGAQDPGPWRVVSVALRCAACVDLSEVLARHG